LRSFEWSQNFFVIIYRWTLHFAKTRKQETAHISIANNTIADSSIADNSIANNSLPKTLDAGHLPLLRRRWMN